MTHNRSMAKNRKNVQTRRVTDARQVRALGIKHLTLRLPSSPDFSGDDDESATLTRMRAMKELMTGSRFTIHALLIHVIEAAPSRRTVLPLPKADPIPTTASFERLDVRVNQAQIDILDTLRDQLKPRPDILDIREYYGRVDVLRALLKMERARLERSFARWIKAHR
jgi:hypothetical protein